MKFISKKMRTLWPCSLILTLLVLSFSDLAGASLPMQKKYGAYYFNEWGLKDTYQELCTLADEEFKRNARPSNWANFQWHRKYCIAPELFQQTTTDTGNPYAGYRTGNLPDGTPIGGDTYLHTYAMNMYIRYVCPDNSSEYGSQCICQKGYSDSPSGQSCMKNNFTISLSGNNNTCALPCKSPVEQVASVTNNGAPAAGQYVTIKIVNSAIDISTITGQADVSGQFKFKYVPPYLTATQAVLEARCTECTNVATKTIAVDACEQEGDNGGNGGDADGGGGGGNCGKGNPILPGTAEKVQTEVDWRDSGPAGLSLMRYYRSQGKLTAAMGLGWTHNYAASVAGSANEQVVRLGSGHRATFHRVGASNNWEAVGSADQLIAISDGWQYIRSGNNNTWHFNAQGQLQRIQMRNGWITRLNYNAAGQLVTVTNAFGRSLRFGYNAQGQLASITPPGGAPVAYGYSATGQLASTTIDGQTRGYLYEDARFASALTGTVDESGQRLGTFAYDAQGRAISTTRAGGAGNYILNYGSSNIGALGGLVAAGTNDPNWYKASVTITNPQGGSETWSYQGGDGTVRVSSVSGAFEGNWIANRSFAPGTTLPTTETDFKGTQHRTTWDSTRRLPLIETSAANRAAETQTTQTEWHPTFRLPVKITETGAQGGMRVTQYTYDDRGNRLSETVTDGTVTPNRSWARSWTYTPQSLLASETDETGAVTTHAYDQWGNRTSTTDPLGRTTTYTHDAAGRVLTQTEPSGILTQFTYDLRGRLLTQTVAGLTTAMTYLPTGLLSTVTQPSGYKTSYTYDAAHRLTGWQDNRGNSGQYVLDGMGNRTSEQIKDSAGNTAWQLSRTINAINRVASETVGGSQSISYQYDANGDLTGHTNGLNQNTAYTLDGLRRLTHEKNPLNASASLKYNSLDAITQAKDFKGVATSYTRDAQGNATQEASPDIGSQSSTFDPRGLTVRTQDAAGNTQHITRDALGRPTTVQASSASASHSSTLGYAPSSGQLQQVQDPGLATQYQRDTQGRTTRKSQSIEAASAP